MGEKWEYTTTSQIDSREPKKKEKKERKKKSDGFPNKMTGISISNFPYYFKIFFSFQSTTSLFLCRKCQMWNLVSHE